MSNHVYPPLLWTPNAMRLTAACLLIALPEMILAAIAGR